MDIKNFIIYHSVGNLFWKDRDFRYGGCNQNFCNLIGVNSSEDIVGKTDVELFDAIDNENLEFLQVRIIDPESVAERFSGSVGEENIGQVIRGIDQFVISSGMNITAEETVFDRNGKQKTLLTKKIPLRDAEGEIIGLSGTAIDISAQKEAQALRLESKNIEEKLKFLTIIAGSVAHELRTPIAGVKSGLQGVANCIAPLSTASCAAESAESASLSLRHLDARNLQSILPRTLRQADYCQLIIDMLLKNITCTSGNIRTDNMSQFAIKSVIDESVIMYPCTPAEAKLIKWNIGSDFLVKGDTILFRHVLWNLLKNALYSIKGARKGTIEISTERGLKFNKVYFKDTGSGMDSAVAEKNFQPFYTSSSSGTGLGLSFCRVVMESFASKIECEGEKDKYTEFTLSFPTNLEI